MPQFTYSATDLAGNVVEGNIAANDMMVAADQVRRMGYTPVRVENTDAAPAARPLTLADTAAAGSHDSAFAPAPAYAPLDLTQAYMEPTAAPNTLNSLLAPAPDLNANYPALAAERRLEPWERSVGAIQTQDANALDAVQDTTAIATTTAQTVTANGLTTPASARTLPTQSQGLRREGVVIPYGADVVTDKGLWQRFLETMVYPIFSGVVMKDMAPFLRQFATLINAGLPLYQSLVALEGNTKNPKLKEIANAGQRQVQAGGRFSDVMVAYPWIFSPMQVAMIRAAEQGGMLDTTLNQVADYLDHDLEIRRLISRETLYPKITLFMALMILGLPGFLGGLPAVSQLVLGGMGNAAGQGYTVLSYLRDTLGFGLALSIPFVAVVVTFRLFLFNVPGVREGCDSIKMLIPVVGKISQMFATAKFARTYAALYKGGFGAGLALSIAGDACGNGVLRRAALDAIPTAERGGLVSEALARSNAFPGMAIDMFRTGETSGALDQMLDRMADFYEAEGKQKSHQAAMIFGVIVFLLVALLVAKSIIEQYMGMAVRSTTLPSEGNE